MSLCALVSSWLNNADFPIYTQISNNQKMKPIRFLFLLVFFSLFLLGKTTAQDVEPKLAEALQNALDSMHQVLGIKGLGAALQLPDGAVWAGGSGVSSLSPPDSVGSEHALHSNDANINSWALASTVQALLKVYLDCEEAISNAEEAVFPVVSASVFPNPFFESITAAVKLPGTISHLDLALADGSGKAIRSARYQGLPAGEQQMTLSNLSGLAPGVYFLDVILDGERVRTFKIIKGK